MTPASTRSIETFGPDGEQKSNWDTATNAADYAPMLTAPSTNERLQPDGSDLGANTYYVRFDDASGAPITDSNGAQWFAVSGPSLGFERGATGATTFGPLTLNVGSNAVATQLESALFNGTPLLEIEVAGYAGGQQQPLVDDYSFGDAYVTAAAANGSGGQQLTFAYVGFQQIHSVINLSGSVEQQTTFDWNVENNDASYSSLTYPRPPHWPRSLRRPPRTASAVRRPPRTTTSASWTRVARRSRATAASSGSSSPASTSVSLTTRPSDGPARTSPSRRSPRFL